MPPRTGCTAIGEGVLMPDLDGEWFPDDGITDPRSGHTILDRKHCDLSELARHGLLSEKDRRELFVFTTTRNPFDSLVSHYYKRRTVRNREVDNPDSFVHRRPHAVEGIKLATEMPFDDWLEWHLRPKTGRQRVRALLRASALNRGNMYVHYAQGADFVMRYERLQDDFAEVQRRIGVERPHEIPRINATPVRDPEYRAYYTPYTRGLVEKVFAADLVHFGYVF
jgi:hypothetical protein